MWGSAQLPPAVVPMAGSAKLPRQKVRTFLENRGCSLSWEPSCSVSGLEEIALTSIYTGGTGTEQKTKHGGKRQ